MYNVTFSNILKLNQNNILKTQDTIYSKFTIPVIPAKIVYEYFVYKVSQGI
jgi:hypothetical protein